MSGLTFLLGFQCFYYFVIDDTKNDIEILTKPLERKRRDDVTYGQTGFHRWGQKALQYAPESDEKVNFTTIITPSTKQSRALFRTDSSLLKMGSKTG